LLRRWVPLWALFIVGMWTGISLNAHAGDALYMLHAGSYMPQERLAGVESYRSLRYRGVIGQTTWYTCGPAALATLLTEYYATPATEAEMLTLAWESMERSGADAEAGITMLALKEALLIKGHDSMGYKVSVAQLVDYFTQGGLPLVLHVTTPQPHYVVGIGMAGNDLIVADPAFGRYLISPADFAVQKGFQGNILVPLPGAEDIPSVRRNQQATIDDANARAGQFAYLRERW